jgi:two-component system alkaline phosphatase synthesis response regulator PhoP
MASQRPKKILIVEDEQDIAQLVRHYLEKEGYHPNIAKTGLEALNLAVSEHPDLIILDLMLPQMDGLEVCKAIRHKPETARLPVIMLTAKKEESDTIVGLELGADDYITKPFSPSSGQIPLPSAGADKRPRANILSVRFPANGPDAT